MRAAVTADDTIFNQ